jgi:hypothetical protein
MRPRPSPVISVLLLVFLCLLGLLVFSATVFGSDPGWTADTKTVLAQDTVFTASVYPQPVGGTINVKIEGTHANEDLEFQLVRVIGDVVFDRNIHSVGSTTIATFRRPMIEKGNYLFRVIRKTNGQMTQGVVQVK